MIGSALIIGVLLSGQLAAADDRYQPPPPRPTGQPAGGNTAGNAAGITIAPFDNQPVTNGADANKNAAPPSGAAGNPYGTSPSTGAAPRTLPLIGTSSPPPATNPSQPPSSGYQAQPNILTNASPPAQPETGMKPSVMMKAMLSTPRNSQLPGESLTLVDVLAGAKTRGEQTQRVEAYWDMCSSIADYYLGLREQEEISKLRSYVPRAGATWQQAEAELTTRIGTSQKAAVAAQLRVASWIGRGTGNLPLPADLPHCANYSTRYDQIFTSRASSEAQQLATLLPLRYAELKDAATAVTRAEQWLDAVAAARNENSDGTGSLRALELLALRRRAFVQIARDYNRRIARYSELATPGQVSAERLTGMLIVSPYTATATKPGTLSPVPSRQSKNAAPSLPRTFVEEWTPANDPRATTATTARDAAVQPTSGTQTSQRQERSLLVPPQ